MKKRNSRRLAAWCMGLASAAAVAHGSSGIRVEHAWARFTVPGMSSGGVFLDLSNRSGRDDELLAAQSAAAQTVELHTHVREQGMMRMRPLPGGIALPQGSQVRLQPGGLHLMLMGLKKPLQAGEHITVTLTFRHAAPQTVSVPVETGAGRWQGGTGHPPHSH